MPTRRIGSASVSAIGLGALPMSIEGRPAEDQAVATIFAALEAGVTLIDTADSYHRDAHEVGHNELLVSKALAMYAGDTSNVLVATKGGHLRPGNGSWTLNGTPEHLKRACDASLRRLRVEAIGLYQFHRPDPAVPYADSIGALRDLLDAGKIRMAGISNANPAQIMAARAILGRGLASVQNQFSPSFLSSEPEIRCCEELGLAFLAWSPLGGPALAPMFAVLHPEFRAIAEGRGVTPHRICLAWMLAKSDVLVALPGASRPATIRDSAAAVEISLSPAELARLP